MRRTRRPLTVRLNLEPLEDRTVPAPLSVFAPPPMDFAAQFRSPAAADLNDPKMAAALNVLLGDVLQRDTPGVGEFNDSTVPSGPPVSPPAASPPVVFTLFVSPDGPASARAASPAEGGPTFVVQSPAPNPVADVHTPVREAPAPSPTPTAPAPAPLAETWQAPATTSTSETLVVAQAYAELPPPPANLAPTQDVPDGVLLQRFVEARDQSAFTALVRRYEPFVLGVAQRVVGDLQVAEDTVQGTFLVLARKAAVLDRHTPLTGWLYRVASRLALRARSVAGRRRRREQADSGRRLAKAAGAPGIDLERRELLQALYEELQALPERFRAPLVLCYVHGRTHAEAAREIGLPRGSIAKRIGQALDVLRDRLADRGLIH